MNDNLELDFYTRIQESPKYEDLIDIDRVEAVALLEDSTRFFEDGFFKHIHLGINCFSIDLF